MPRRRPTPRRPRALPPALGSRRIEEGPDGYAYEVRPVAAARATKTYRCPGCDQEVKPAVAHVVVLPTEAGESAVDDRRHWHTACWENRRNRNPTRKWC